jgi:hypothetical protein
MPRIDKEAIENALRVLEKTKVVTLKQVVSFLKCSMPGARLKLNQWRALTSYNQNGRYYTLPDIPQFDENGLWRFKDVYFSKHGNLKKTIIYLVSNSSSGLTGKQIGDLLGLSPQSFLHHFRDCKGIVREKHDGVYAYFSDQSERYDQQIQSRSTAISSFSEPSFSDVDAVVILVALIKHPEISVEDILALPEIKRKKYSPVSIRRFLESHDLLKKTPDTRQ